jgi:hypothetical protein
VLKDKNETLDDGVVNRVWSCKYDNCAITFGIRGKLNTHLKVCSKGGRKHKEQERKKVKRKRRADP